MDIPAFGTLYPQVSSLPYASGFVWTPADGPKTFSTCRGISCQTTNNSNVVYIEMNDGQGQILPVGGWANRPLLPVGATAISGGNVNSVVVFY